MDDLLQLQIQESCKLALPNGLNELMYDISREVLRAQPTNLCEFITNYLSALLITRENLQVASKICDNVCENLCHLGLEGDLRSIGLCDEDVQVVKEIINVYFAKEHVSETNIIKELFAKTDISEDQIESIQLAIQTAFKRHQATNTTVFESTSSESEISDSTRAARHTVRLYRTTKPTEQEYEKAAGNIQAAYRAYGVRRRRDWNRRMNSALPADIADGRPTKSLRFGSDDDLCSRSTYTGSLTDVTSNVTEKTEDIFVSQSAYKPAHLATDSSTSLAGSLVLPSNKPYCVHDTLLEENEGDFSEKEHSNVDYTLLDSEKMGPCKSTEYIEDNVSCAEDSEASIEEDMIDLNGMDAMKGMYEIDDVIEAEMEDYHIFETKQTVKIGQEDDDETIARDSIIESDQNIADDIIFADDQYTDNVDNEDAYDSMVEDDIKLDADVIISDDGIIDDNEDNHLIVELDKNSLNYIRSEDRTVQHRNLETGSASHDKINTDSITKGKQYIGSLLELNKDIEDIVVESHVQSSQNATDDNVVSHEDDEHVNGIASVEKDANHLIEKDILLTHDLQNTILAKSHEEINPDPSQQYFHVNEFNGSENVTLEKSTVPKTPFHSLTNFDDNEDDEDEVPE